MNQTHFPGKKNLESFPKMHDLSKGNYSLLSLSLSISSITTRSAYLANKQLLFSINVLASVTSHSQQSTLHFSFNGVDGECLLRKSSQTNTHSCTNIWPYRSMVDLLFDSVLATTVLSWAGGMIIKWWFFVHMWCGLKRWRCHRWGIPFKEPPDTHSFGGKFEEVWMGEFGDFTLSLPLSPIPSLGYQPAQATLNYFPLK